MIAKYLDFNMTSRRHEAFEIHVTVAKCCACFGLATGVGFLDLVGMADHTHTASTASGHGFDDDRYAGRTRLHESPNLSEAGRSGGTSQHRHTALSSELTCTYFITEQCEQIWTWPDEGNA